MIENRKKQLILILGGARSGKSRFAQELARTMGRRVIFLATAEAEDEEMRRRIEEHRKSRPQGWRTIEAPTKAAQVVGKESRRADLILLDCLALLMSNLLLAEGEEIEEQAAEARVLPEIEGLLRAFATGRASLIVVSNEVGMGVVPPYPLGRAYRDLLGKANQSLAQAADQVYWMIAGLPVEIKASGLSKVIKQSSKGDSDGQD